MLGDLALIGAIVATTVAQISYKKRSIGGSREYLIAAIAFFAVTPALTYIAVKILGVGITYMSTSVTYILVSIAGWVIFGETIKRRKVLALSLIATGIATYSLGTL
ncbi:EamA family transporter [Cognatiluteimonas weifangensis]|uniref:Uncharacterized protein n=1 Tax=Cognatiluteimonas weifangensis TaxID=2303539 RepID=A0A372DM06_9GAMM|nr:EamA family transporter [Luteimonas weifangensis]RFP60556.1 hypothetical protein D0Y53_07620 [Luteimonas weifangensis]